ncbi:hypothetical protein GQ457_18G009430 [Hibiscus cannabinus]
MTKALARTLCACIGKVVMMDTRLEDGNMGEFLRVRVSLDTTKPLRRCVTLSRPTTKAIFCPLQYERVPIFCHGCGLIGHIPKRPTVARPRGHVSVVKDADLPPLSPAPSVASSPPSSVSTATASVPAPAATDVAASVLASVGPATSVAPLAPGCDAMVSAPLPACSSRVNVHVACDNEAPYDPMLHRDISDAMEDSLDVPNGWTMFSDLDGMINVDGAFLTSTRLGAIGDLARDSSGAVLGGFARPVPVVGLASAVEASALLAGLEYAIARGWASALVESDAAVLVNKLHRPTSDLSLLGGLLAPSCNLVAASRDCLRVGFAARSANSAAHTLASWACQHNDDTLHALCNCPDSSLALRQVGFANTLLSTDQTSSAAWLGFAASTLSQRSLALLLTLLWGLWRRRNTWVHEHNLYPLHLTVQSAISLCHDYASAFAPSKTPPTTTTPTAAAPPRWRPPPTGYVKINVDGAFLPTARLGAIGVLARDSSGAVLGGFARSIPVIGPASTVEASALFAGLEFSIANGWASALIESNATVLVHKLNRPTTDLSLLGDLLAPSRHLIAASCGCLRVGFAPIH